MYRYKHKTTGEVVVTSNKVTSKNWEPVKDAGKTAETKTATANAGGTKKGDAKTGGTKKGDAKTGGTKKGDTKKEEAKEAEGNEVICNG